MKAFWNKLRGGGNRNPTKLEDFIGEPVVTAPIDGANHTQPPRVEVASITPGVWYGEPATLVLLTVSNSGDPAIPKAVVAVHLSSADNHRNDQPIIIGWGPDNVVSEEQSLEHDKSWKTHDISGANKVSVSADVGMETRDDSVQHGTSRGMFTRKPIDRSPAGYSGVKFVLTPASGSKKGLPTWIRLAVVYKCKGAVELDIDLNVLKTWRRHIPTLGEHQPLVWDQSEGFLAQALQCSECSTPRCRDFGHAKKQFWYSLLNQSNLEHHSTIPFASNPSDVGVFLLANTCSPAELVQFGRKGGAVERSIVDNEKCSLSVTFQRCPLPCSLFVAPTVRRIATPWRHMQRGRKEYV